MNKEKLKGRIIRAGKSRYLSAQEYAHLTISEKAAMRNVLKENDIDPDEYEKGMKKLWPKVWVPKPTVWVNR